MGGKDNVKIDPVSETEEKPGKKAAAGSEPEDAKAKTADTTPGIDEELQAAKQEAAQSYDRFLRVAAEFDNYKKRTAREMDDLRKYAKEALLKDLLNVVDNLERALESSNSQNGTGDGILEGVHMTLQELFKIFEKNNVRPIEAVGQPFDPAFHQAFMTEPSGDHPENTVLKEFQKGYTLHDRLLRPAMVVVSKSETTGESKDREPSSGTAAPSA